MQKQSEERKCMEDKSNPGAKKSWLIICGRMVWLVTLAICILIGAFAVFATATSRDTIIPQVVLVFAIAGIFLLILIRLLFSRRFRRSTVFFILSLVTLVALFYAEEDLRGKHAWNRCQREWAAKAEKIDWQFVVPPSVPDDQNFAMAPVVASSYLQILDGQGHQHPYDTNIVDRLAMDINGGREDNKADLGDWGRGSRIDLAAWQTFYRTLAAKTNFFPVPPQPQSPAADVLLALSPFNGAIEDLRQAAQLPESRFPLEYDKDDPSAILLPHLGAIKRSGIVLSLRVTAELQNNQSAAAAADVKLTFRLIDSIRSEPFLISHLVRISLLQIALQPVWEGLADHCWSDGQLAALGADLAKFNFSRDYQISMKGEIVLGEHNMDYLRQIRHEIVPLFYNWSDDGKQDEFNVPAGLVTWIPAGWFYQNKANYANMMLKYFVPIADIDQMTISPLAERRANNALASDTRHFIPYKLWEKLIIPAVGHVGNKFARAQAFADMARVAIALERFRLVHGAYPATLDVLAPQFLAEIPHDVIDGEPLHYRLEANGQFTLYSVGWNGRDDGGTVVLVEGSTPHVNYNEGDWVWRYPAQ